MEADAVRLQQVFWNLPRNAISCRVGGHVGIGCHRRGDSSVAVEVSDDGLGIAPELLPHVFNTFEQGDEDQIEAGGWAWDWPSARPSWTGRRHHHRPERGQGQGGIVLGPPADHGWRAVRPGGTGARRIGHAGSCRPAAILLVEDHADSGGAIRQLLMADGHAVQRRGDVATGLGLAGQQPFDLLISDLDLPDGSGLELIYVPRRGSTLPGFTLSGYGQDQDIGRAVRPASPRT